MMVSNLEKRLGECFKQWRILQGYTQKWVAEAAGIDIGTLRRIETGAGASISAMLTVARVLGIDQHIMAALDPFAHDLGRFRSHLLDRKRVSRKNLL